MSAGHVLLNSFYIAINVGDILYGVQLFLYFKTIRVLLSTRGAHKKSNLFYALFSTVMLFLITVWVVAQAIFGQRMWLADTDFPGGPLGYWKTNLAVWYMEWSTVSVIVLQLMTDGFMIYRCRIIWGNYHVVAVPIILWLTTLILGVLLAWINSFPGEDFATGLAGHFSRAYWSISVFLNATLTCMICYRVLRHGRQVREHLGPEFASFYFVVAAIVIESILPYTLSGIAYLISLGVRTPTFPVFLFVYLLMMCISPQMSILRVMIGRAWNNDTFSHAAVSTAKFVPGDAPGLESP